MKSEKKLQEYAILASLAALFVVITMLGYNVRHMADNYFSNISAALLAGDNLIVYDGEQGSASLLTGSRNCLTYATEVSGGRNSTKALRFSADPWHASGYYVNCGGQDRLNFSPYSYIEFYIKGDKTSTTPRDFNIVSFYGRSNTVNILDYIEGKTIDTTWRLVSIPVSALKTSSYNLSTVDEIYFGTDNQNLTLYIDDLAARKTKTSVSTASNTTSSTETASIVKIYDGEREAPLLGASCVSYAEEVSNMGQGSRTLKLKPDAYHSPGLKINCGGRDRIDASGYASIEFHVKADNVDTNDAQFNVVSYYGRSNTVSIKRYIQAGAIDTNWRLVVIPISDLKTAQFNLSAIDDLYFGMDPQSRALYVDNIVLKKTKTTGYREPPVAAQTPRVIYSTGATQSPVPTPVSTPSVKQPQTQPQQPVPVVPVVPVPPVIPEPKPVVPDQSIIKDFFDNLFGNDPEPVDAPVAQAISQGELYDFDEVDLANRFGQWLYPENTKHISLNFVEKYDVNKIKNNSNYTISSVDDLSYQEPKQARFVGYRWRTYYAPTIRKTDLKVAYRIFLELPYELEDGKTYTVIANNIGIETEPFTFRYDEQALNKNIKINQVGYLPNASKIGYLGQYMGTGGPMPFTAGAFYVQDASGKTVLTGIPALRNIDTNNTGEQVYEMNFSSITTPGTYKLYIPKVGTSYPFRIGNDVYNEVLGNAFKGAYHQRASTSLSPNFTRFTHGPAHMADAYVMNHDPIPTWFRDRFDSQGDTSKREGGKRAYYGTSLSGQFINTSKGHYDAGDYGKYVVNGALFVGNLLAGYDAFPGHLMKDDLHVPESGNGVPDVLEEAKWELDWLENMQDPNDGGVFCIVKPDGAIEYYENRRMDDPSPSRRLLYPKDTTCTAHFAGALAKAGANEYIRKYYPDAAARYVLKAKKAWTFLENNSGYLGWHHYAVKDEFHPTDKSMDDRVWAAVELYNATGEKQYLDFTLANHKPEYVRWGWHTLFEAHGQSIYACAFIKRSGMENLKARCVDQIIKAADSHVKDAENRAYRLSMSDAPLNYRDFTYFFPQERIIQLLIANILKPNPAYTQTALYNWDYVLGANPTGYSYVTGIGSKRFREVVSTQTMYDNIKPPVPGLPIGMGNNFGYLEVYKGQLSQMFPPNNAGSPDPKVSYPLLAQVYDGWNIGVEFTIPEIAQNIISAAYFGTRNDAKNTPPGSVNIVADKVTGKVPLKVSFKGSGVDSDGRIVRYHWDFDDETYSIQQNPVHTFVEPYKVYKVTLTITDNDGAERYRTIDIRTTPASFAFTPEPHVGGADTHALFHFDSSFAESAGKGYTFRPVGAELSSENILWMRNPAGKSVKFDSVEDRIEIDLPRKTIMPTADSPLVVEAKLYVDTFLAANNADAKMFVMSQQDTKLFGLFDAKYVDGTNVQVMDGYSDHVRLLTKEQIGTLMNQGKMSTNSWYNLKFVIAGGRTQVYVNNDKVAETAVAPQFADSDAPIRLQFGGFKGFVDEVRVGSR